MSARLDQQFRRLRMGPTLQRDLRLRRGPLSGITVVEMAGIGPGPFAGMML